MKRGSNRLITPSSQVAREHREGGFTLIEVLIAIACLAILVPAILGAYSTMLQLNKNSTMIQDYVNEVQLARRLLNQDFNTKDLSINSLTSDQLIIVTDGLMVEYRWQNNALYRRQASDSYEPIIKNVSEVTFSLEDVSDNTVRIILTSTIVKDTFTITVRNAYKDFDYDASVS